MKPNWKTALTAALLALGSALILVHAQPAPLVPPTPEELKALAAEASKLSPDAGQALAAGDGAPLLDYSESKVRMGGVWGLQLGTQSGLIACKAGHLLGCRLQALYMARLVPPHRTTEQFNIALSHAERACNAGHAPSCDAATKLADTRHATGSSTPLPPVTALPPGCTRGDTEFADAQLQRALEDYRGQVRVFVADFHRMADAVDAGRMSMKYGAPNHGEYARVSEALQERRASLAKAAARLHEEHSRARCLVPDRLKVLQRERDAWHPGPYGQAPRRPSIYSWSCDARNGSRSTDYGPKDYCTQLQRGSAD